MSDDRIERRMDKKAARRKRRNTRDVVRATRSEGKPSGCPIFALTLFVLPVVGAIGAVKGWA